jgi:hypothetical protein
MLLLENISHLELKKYLKEYYNYAKKHLKIDRNPSLVLKTDKLNSEDLFGKTGYYNPDTEEICLYVSNRHGKDIIRSFAHELIHHEQKCRGLDKDIDLSKTANDPAYASHDEGLRKMESEAFERGNMMFRDWCDMHKLQRKNDMTIKNTVDMKEDDTYGDAEAVGATPTNESNNPYPELFKKKDRLFQDRFAGHEEEIFKELLKRALK